MEIRQLLSSPGKTDVAEPRIGISSVIDGYSVDRELSRATRRYTVYEASGPSGDRVAIKVYRVPSNADGQFRRRFRRQLELRASIQDPHLLRVVGGGQHGDESYVIMALSRAPTLATVLESAPLEERRCLSLLSQVAKALEAAHSRRLVHWDLSPHDVLVEPGGDGHVLLGDFGIAKPEGRGGLHDFVDFAYMSPEEIREELLVPQSNVYALACILVECLTGSPPYASEHRLGVAYAHILQPPPRLTERRPDLPPAIDGVLATAMAKDPDDRLYSPSELVRAAAEALGLGLPGPGGPIGPPGRRLERLSAGSRAGERDAGTREHPRAVATVRGLRRLLTGTKRVA